jgi:hypothetical protein
MLIQLPWLVAGMLTGLVIGTVFVPPTRKTSGVPKPGSPEVFHTDTGCVRFEATEVPCTAEPDSLNLLASQK